MLLSHQEQKERESTTTTTTTNPFATSVSQPVSTSTTESPSLQARPSDDLLNLTGNPFADSVQNVMVMNTGVNAMQPPQAQNAFGAPPPGWGGQTNAPGAGNFIRTISHLQYENSFLGKLIESISYM